VRARAASASALADEVLFPAKQYLKHLAVLEDTGLVTRHRERREVRFTIDPLRVDEVTRVIMQWAGESDRRLKSIKRIAKTAHRSAPRHKR
jgi:DNA-binding transcriptional ArsR family regulator